MTKSQFVEQVVLRLVSKCVIDHTREFSDGTVMKESEWLSIRDAIESSMWDVGYSLADAAPEDHQWGRSAEERPPKDRAGRPL